MSPKLDESKAALARELAQDKERPIKEICDLLKISRTTFYKYTASLNGNVTVQEESRPKTANVRSAA